MITSAVVGFFIVVYQWPMPDEDASNRPAKGNWWFRKGRYGLGAIGVGVLNIFRVTAAVLDVGSAVTDRPVQDISALSSIMTR